jgi:hypothetical protein
MHRANRSGYAGGLVNPTRDEVEERWQQLIDGVLTREQVHTCSAPWVRSQDDLDDPIVEIGLLHLFGFDLSRPEDISTDTSGVLQQHGGEPGRVYLSSVADVAAELEQWRRDARAFDDNPAKWGRHRLEDLHRRVLREGRLEEAHRVRRLFARPDHSAHPL